MKKLRSEFPGKLETKPKLVLIDGNAIIHRAYHALPKTMTNRKGQMTNAIYGFTTTLIKVLEDLRPQYIATSFDLAGPTFRHEQYKEYKATRVKADQELYDQIPKIKELVELMDIPIYEEQGFEADDCIGTIVEKIRNTNIEIRNKSKSENCSVQNWEIEIYIVSGDKDIYQLVDSKVKVYSLRRGLSQMQVVDHQTIEKEYNLQPADFIDLKALAGDASDNIPGVPGIGPKTATELIQKFDSLEKLYKFLEANSYQLTAISLIKPRIVDLLKKYKEQAFLSQKLATIHRDVPIKFSLEECKWGEYDRNKLQEFFEELGFNSLLKRFGVTSEKSEIPASPAGRQANVEINSKPEIKRNDEQLKLL